MLDHNNPWMVVSREDAGALRFEARALKAFGALLAGAALACAPYEWVDSNAEAKRLAFPPRVEVVHSADENQSVLMWKTPKPLDPDIGTIRVLVDGRLLQSIARPQELLADVSADVEAWRLGGDARDAQVAFELEPRVGPRWLRSIPVRSVQRRFNANSRLRVYDSPRAFEVEVNFTEPFATPLGTISRSYTTTLLDATCAVRKASSRLTSEWPSQIATMTTAPHVESSYCVRLSVEDFEKEFRFQVDPTPQLETFVVQETLPIEYRPSVVIPVFDLQFSVDGLCTAAKQRVLDALQASMDVLAEGAQGRVTPPLDLAPLAGDLSCRRIASDDANLMQQRDQVVDSVDSFSTVSVVFVTNADVIAPDIRSFFTLLSARLMPRVDHQVYAFVAPSKVHDKVQSLLWQAGREVLATGNWNDAYDVNLESTVTQMVSFSLPFGRRLYASEEYVPVFAPGARGLYRLCSVAGPFVWDPPDPTDTPVDLSAPGVHGYRFQQPVLHPFRLHSRLERETFQLQGQVCLQWCDMGGPNSWRAQARCS